MADSSPPPDVGCEVEVSSKKRKRGESTRGHPSKRRRASARLATSRSPTKSPTKRQRRVAAPTKRKACRQTKQSKAKKNPPESETQRKRKALNKTEKAKITLSIRETDVDGGIVPTVTEVVTAQSHIQSCPDKVLFGRHLRFLVSS